MKISIIGLGRLGTVLANSVVISGFEVADLVVRDIKTNNSNKKFSNSPNLINSVNKIQCADIYFITTQDKYIYSVASELIKAPNFNSDAIVVHCSGILDHHVLKETGITNVCSAHPLASFATSSSKQSTLSGVFCTIEGDPISVEKISGIFNKFGAIPIPTVLRDKRLYHLAAVFGSNFINVLFDISNRLFIESGVEHEKAKQITLSLINSVTRNINEFGNGASVSGPLVRGDLEVIEKHIQVMKNLDPLVESIYKSLSNELSKIT